MAGRYRATEALGRGCPQALWDTILGNAIA